MKKLIILFLIYLKSLKSIFFLALFIVFKRYNEIIKSCYNNN